MASWFWTVPVCSFAILAGCAAHAGLPTYSTVPNFNLTDQTGEPFESAAKVRGKVWIADFIYTTCPGPCPRMSSQMHEVEKALAGENDVRLVSFTVDPEHDTPLVLAAYGQRFGATPGVWYFLTGSRDTLQHLCRDVFMLGNVDGTLEHSTRFVLVDRDSRVRGFYDTSEADSIPRVIADAKRLAAGKN
jgi:protein SCO1